MKFDEYGVLVSEIWPDVQGFAGNRGDSMANTSRYNHLLDILQMPRNPNMRQFVSKTGYLRHPSPVMPDDWKESDSPTDQCLPFFVAAPPAYQDEMRDRIKASGWRTGNGDLVSPLFYAVLKSSQLGINVSLIGQLAIFKIPFRWSDSKHNFELSANSSADVLNFFHCLPLASPWVRKLVKPDWVMEKITDYFLDRKTPEKDRRPEPNVSWILDLYAKAIVAVLG